MKFRSLTAAADNPHHNTEHSNFYMSKLNLIGATLSGDVTVDGNAAYTLNANNIAFSLSVQGFLMAQFGYNLRLGTAAANDIVNVWIETSPDNATWTQRTSKYPTTVLSANKQHSSDFLPGTSAAQRLFWNAPKTNQTVYVRVQAQRAVADALTDIFSEVYLNILFTVADVA